MKNRFRSEILSSAINLQLVNALEIRCDKS